MLLENTILTSLSFFFTTFYFPCTLRANSAECGGHVCKSAVDIRVFKNRNPRADFDKFCFEPDIRGGVHKFLIN